MKKLISVLTALLIFAALPFCALAEGLKATPITSVTFTGYTVPQPGETQWDNVDISAPSGSNYYLSQRGWMKCGSDGSFIPMDDDEVFAAGEAYSLMLDVFAKTGYEFAPDCTFTMDGGSVQLYMRGGDGTAVFLGGPVIICGSEDYLKIPAVSVNGFEKPAAGERVGEHISLTVPAGAHYSIGAAVWLNAGQGGAPMSADSVFTAGGVYVEAVFLSPEPGYVFADGCELYMNGGAVYIDPVLTEADPGAVIMYTRAFVCGEAPQYLPGDVNGSGAVETEDALLTLREALDIAHIDAGMLPAADVDGDWCITTTDALLILRTALNIH